MKTGLSGHFDQSAIERHIRAHVRTQSDWCSAQSVMLKTFQTKPDQTLTELEKRFSDALTHVGKDFADMGFDPFVITHSKTVRLFEHDIPFLISLSYNPRAALLNWSCKFSKPEETRFEVVENIIDLDAQPQLSAAQQYAEILMVVNYPKLYHADTLSELIDQLTRDTADYSDDYNPIAEFMLPEVQELAQNPDFNGRSHLLLVTAEHTQS